MAGTLPPSLLMARTAITKKCGFPYLGPAIGLEACQIACQNSNKIILCNHNSDTLHAGRHQKEVKN